MSQLLHINEVKVDAGSAGSARQNLCLPLFRKTCLSGFRVTRCRETWHFILNVDCRKKKWAKKLEDHKETEGCWQISSSTSDSCKHAEVESIRIFHGWNQQNQSGTEHWTCIHEFTEKQHTASCKVHSCTLPTCTLHFTSRYSAFYFEKPQSHW